MKKETSSIDTRVSVIENDYSNFKVDIKSCLQEIKDSMRGIANSTIKNSETFQDAVHSLKIASTNEISAIREQFKSEIDELRMEKNTDISNIKIKMAYYSGGIAAVVFIISYFL